MNLLTQIRDLLASRAASTLPVGQPQWLGQHTASDYRRSKRAAIKLIGNRQFRRRNILAYGLRDARRLDQAYDDWQATR